MNCKDPIPKWRYYKFQILPHCINYRLNIANSNTKQQFQHKLLLLIDMEATNNAHRDVLNANPKQLKLNNQKTKTKSQDPNC